jgi:hypothetical protein
VRLATFVVDELERLGRTSFIARSLMGVGE